MTARWLTAALLLCSCENEVSVQLLPTPPPDTCVPGDPCSGLSRALRFRDAYDRVEVPSSSLLDFPQDFAFEAWVFVESYENGHAVLNRWASALGDIQLTFGTPEPLPVLELPTAEPAPSHVLASWVFVKPETWLSVVAPERPTTGAWHHLASSYGGGSFRLYVDGKLVGSVEGTEPVPNPASTLFIGASGRTERALDPTQGTPYWPPIDGYIADVRLSSDDRYPSEFTPEVHLSPDASTLGLWHLDEAEGATAQDSGPNQLTGTIHGAEWELAPIRGRADSP